MHHANIASQRLVCWVWFKVLIGTGSCLMLPLYRKPLNIHFCGEPNRIIGANFGVKVVNI